MPGEEESNAPAPRRAVTDQQVAKQKNLSVERVRQIQATRGISNEAILQLSDPTLRRAVRRADYPDMPRARQAFRLQQERDDAGRVRRNGLSIALSELDSARARAAQQRTLVAGIPVGRDVAPRSLIAPPTAGLNPDNTGWIPLGPGNIGGRVRSLAVHPGNPNTLWAASVGGGIWRSIDAGVSWQPVNDLMANLAVSCMVMDPTDPDILYAGTGEGFANLDALRGAGIFRTTDGTNWKQLPSTIAEDFQKDFQAVNRLALSANGGVLLAATPRGLFRSEDPDRLNWDKVLGAGLADVRFHPTDNNKAIAGGLDDGNAYLSTDGGKTWTQAAHGSPWSGRVEVTYAVMNPNVVYASVQMTTGEIWRSTNGGKNFTKRTGKRTGTNKAAAYLGDQGWYDNVIWAGDPTNADFVIVGGIDLWRSADGGNTLTDISTWWDSRSAHADHHCIVSHPDYDGVNNRTVFFGNDGGIYRADDVTTVGNDAQVPRVAGWTELNNTFGVTQFYGGAGNPTSGTIIGGTQDNGTLCRKKRAGLDGWTSMFGGDGGWCAADPNDPNVFYGEYVYLNIHRNMDGGATDDTLGDRYISGQFWNPNLGDWDWKPFPFHIPDARSQNALFIAPFILDPNESNRILAGGLSLWRTNDAKTPNTTAKGPSWASIKNSVGSFISALAVAKGDPNTVWVGHVNGDVYKTANGTDAQPVWQKMSGQGTKPLSPSRYCTGITVDPANKKTVYVTFGGYVRGNVWKTTDAGATWHNIGASLPEAPVRALAVHPRNAGFLYLGTEVGVFASEDGGATWSPTNEGPTNCSVDDLFWMDEILVCVTHGRGMFQIDLSGV
jgi:hypothetical protein